LSKQKSVADQIVNRCKHFNGFRGYFAKDPKAQVCKCGIKVRALVGGDDLGWISRTPCLADHETDVVCSKREFPTREEAEAEARESEAHTKATLLAMKRCIEDSDDRGFSVFDSDNRPDVAGEIQCPACGGTLKYSRSGYNGHIWGKCETEGCLQWMQ